MQKCADFRLDVLLLLNKLDGFFVNSRLMCMLSVSFFYPDLVDS